MNGKLRNLIDTLGSHGGAMLVCVLVIVAGAWGFVELLDEVQEGETQKFDELAMRWLARWHGPQYRWLEEIGRDFTALGGNALLTVFALAVVGFLAMVRKYHAMWLVIIATSGGLLLSSLLKWMVDRQRPNLGEHLSHVYTSSFPSGHSMMSAVVYLTLGSLLAALVQRRRLKFYFIGVALLLTLLVGVSRVYMRVHWPTDVLAGWTAGLVWALLCWIAGRYLQRRGAVEADVETPTETTQPMEAAKHKDS